MNPIAGPGQAPGNEDGLSACFVTRCDRPMAMIRVYAGNTPDRVIVDQCLRDGSCGSGSSF